MSADLYTELAWLPRPPADFAGRCKQLLDGDGPVGHRLRSLAGYGLNENELQRLARLRARAHEAGRTAPLTPLRLGIISNATAHFLAPALSASALRYGFDLECVEADFGQTIQAALAPDSPVNQSRPDYVLVALDYRGLPLAAALGSDATAETAVAAALEYLEVIRNGLFQHGGAASIVQSLAPPPETTFGSLDLALAGTARHVIHEFNRRLARATVGGRDRFLDVAAIAETVGLANWHDPTLWNVGKLPCANTYLPLYADHVCRLIAAARGKSRRALVLDLDNTLWGGVIGDDGLEGIVLGQGDASGEAYLSVQRTALALRERGIVLAVSSKNEDAVARRAFQEHPEMLLRESHVAVFQANWNDKATNIRAIAAELALGLDAFVFLDDNPAERALVRRELPEVAVPELPEDPALYARTLLAAGYFEAVVFSAEDRQRADFYQDNARRVALERATGDLASYLRSLDMSIHFAPFDDVGKSRIVQLINKSNQFNLTTRRYSDADIEGFMADPTVFTLQVRLADRFGDNGMISVVICRTHSDQWEIDTWLMSCRVLGRGVERAVLDEIARAARGQGIKRLLGTYIPTGRNQLVADHYAKLGFEPAGSGEKGATRWAYALDEHVPSELPMVIVREEETAS